MSDTEITMYPVEIAKAIIAVKKQVKQLGVSDRNEHGKYSYVSVDKFYERIGKLMADAGLALLIDETASDVRDGKSGNPWLFAQYALRFMQESGAVSEPLRRSLAMPINGPQTYGAAQSYIEKQFLRQVFKVPTGEKDADDTAQDDAPAPKQPARTNGATRTASAPPLPSNGVNKAALPVSPEETPEITAARHRIRMLIDKLDATIRSAPNEHKLTVAMDDAIDEFKEIEAAGPNGKAAAEKLREKFNARLSAFQEAA